jgi:hypothetical protein
MDVMKVKRDRLYNDYEIKAFCMSEGMEMHNLFKENKKKRRNFENANWLMNLLGVLNSR